MRRKTTALTQTRMRVDRTPTYHSRAPRAPRTRLRELLVQTCSEDSRVPQGSVEMAFWRVLRQKESRKRQAETQNVRGTFFGHVAVQSFQRPLCGWRCKVALKSVKLFHFVGNTS